MSLFQGLLGVAVAALLVAAYAHVSTDYAERARSRQAAETLSSVRVALDRWSASERRDADAFGFSTVTSADLTGFVDGHLGRDPLTAGAAVSTAAWPAAVIENVGPGGIAIGLRWDIPDGRWIDVYALGEWSARDRTYAMAAMPEVRYAARDDPAFASDPVFARDRNRYDALVARLPHVASQSALSGVLRHHGTVSGAAYEGLVSPPVFGGDAIRNIGFRCDETASTLAFDQSGVPLVCEPDDGGVSTWTPIMVGRPFCRDTRLSTTDPGWNKNAPFKRVVLDTGWATGATAASTERTFSVRPGGPANACPKGFVLDATTGLCDATVADPTLAERKAECEAKGLKWHEPEGEPDTCTGAPDPTDPARHTHSCTTPPHPTLNAGLAAPIFYQSCSYSDHAADGTHMHRACEPKKRPRPPCCDCYEDRREPPVVPPTGTPEADCVTDGGAWHDDLGVCEMAGASCATGWKRAWGPSYASTRSNTCSGDTDGCGRRRYPSRCTTGSHAFGTGASETCMYEHRDRCCLGLTCTHNDRTCYATIASVGCVGCEDGDGDQCCPPHATPAGPVTICTDRHWDASLGACVSSGGPPRITSGSC